MEKLNKPRRQKSDQSNQQKNSSQDRARRAAPDPLFKKRLQWLEKLNSEVRQNFLRLGLIVATFTGNLSLNVD